MVSVEFADQFPVDAIQVGAGTPMHMNVNEVITNRAMELLNPKRMTAPRGVDKELRKEVKKDWKEWTRSNF